VIAVDTNVLVYAHREKRPQHQQPLMSRIALAEGAWHWALPVFCLGEFVRVVTHPRIFTSASSLQAALDAINGLLKSPSLRILSPSERFLELFQQCLLSVDARGNVALDAQIAAVCREHSVTRLLTMVGNFARFPSIETVAISTPPQWMR